MPLSDPLAAAAQPHEAAALHPLRATRDQRAASAHADELGSEGVALASLGFDADTLARLLRLARAPGGLLLATGPGARTTLRALIGEIDGKAPAADSGPSGCGLAGLARTAFGAMGGFGFAGRLRTVLHHQADSLLIADTVEPEAAQFAVRAALAGRRVFAGMQAGSVLDVIGRFERLNVPAVRLVSALGGIVVQRLVRRVCADCAAPASPDGDRLGAFGIDAVAAARWRFASGRGCVRCGGTGYRGYAAIAEVLPMDDALRQLVIERRPAVEIEEAARRKAAPDLRESALALVRAGLSTLEEIDRLAVLA